MAGRKTKSASKKKSQPGVPKYIVTPASPAKTRSADRQPSPPRPAAVPTVPVSPASMISSEISALESRFDTRMSEMESTIRASLTSALSAAATSGIVAPVPAAPAAPSSTPSSTQGAAAATPVVAPVAKPTRSTSASSSSSAGSAARSSSSDSSTSRSRDRHSRTKHRRTHRSSRRRSRKTSRNKYGKYTTLRYVPEHKVITTYERLILANLRMMLRFYKKERDIKGMLKHSILLAEKADGGYFHDEALINYDESIKAAADEEGITSFSKLDPAAIIKHLSYDGTKAARAARNKGTSKPAAAVSRPSGNGTLACFKFNFASGGCRRTKCNYPHVCSACSGAGHVNADCPNVDRPNDKASRK